MEIFSASHGVKTFHAIIDNFSAASQVTPPVFTVRPMCAYCKIIIVQFITLVGW